MTREVVRDMGPVSVTIRLQSRTVAAHAEMTDDPAAVTTILDALMRGALAAVPETLIVSWFPGGRT